MPLASGERAPETLQAHASADPAARRSPPPGLIALVAHGVTTLLCGWGAGLFLTGWWREASAADERAFWALPTFAAAALTALTVRYVTLLAACRNAAARPPRQRQWLRVVDIAARTAMCLACLAVIWAAHSLPTRASGDVDVLVYGVAWVSSLLCAFWQVSIFVWMAIGCGCALVIGPAAERVWLICERACYYPLADSGATVLLWGSGASLLLSWLFTQRPRLAR